MKKEILLFTFLLFSLFGISQPNLYWDYPIKPGTSDWQKLHNQKLKVEACQIPNDMLKNISTENLLNLYFTYPLLLNIVVFPTFQLGMNDLAKNFNGIIELFSRNESLGMLIEKYLNAQITSLNPNWSSVEQGQHAFYVLSLELILSQDAIVSKLADTDKKLLMIDIVQKLNEKTNSLIVYDYVGVKSTCYLLTKLFLQTDLQTMNISVNEVKDLIAFSNSTSLYNKFYLTRIVELADSIISRL